jgi:hypothetical protein
MLAASGNRSLVGGLASADEQEVEAEELAEQQHLKWDHRRAAVGYRAAAGYRAEWDTVPCSSP